MKMDLLKIYKSPSILLGSVVLGGVIGLKMGAKASVLEPFGNLFLNLMFMILVPLVFFSISSAIASMKSKSRLGKILASVLAVFAFTSAIAALLGFAGALLYSPAKGIDTSAIQSLAAKAGEAQQAQQVSPLQQVVNTFTVSDFSLLFSKSNMLQVIVFAVIFGFAASSSGERGRPVVQLLESASAVMMKLVDIIMYYAPVGLLCFFASVIGQLGSQIITGYLRVFTLYIGIAVVYYFGFYTFYAYLAGGSRKVRLFWSNALKPSVTALATCSSAACIPVNIETTQKMGVPKDIAEMVCPLGANIHKDGSVIGGMMKITFLFSLFGRNMTSPASAASIILVSFLVGAVMAAIPSGGFIAEMLILSIFGFPSNLLPIIAVISTIIDAPATLLNSTGNTVSAMMVASLVEKGSVPEAAEARV
jgi:Na+/H+-dicarboxylate symporter